MFLCLSPNVWRDVGRRWRGIGHTYLLLLLAASWLVTGIKAQFIYNNFVDNESKKFTSQVPRIDITNGVVSCDRKQPYSIVDPQSGKVFAIVDTTGQTTVPPSPAGLLLTRDSVISRTQDGQMRTMPLTNVKSFNMDQARVDGWLQRGKGWLWILFTGLVFVSSTYRQIQLLIYAAIGFAFASAFNAKLSYGALLRLAAIAITPVIVIDTILMFTPLPNLGCGWTVGGIALSLIVLALAVKANGAPVPPPMMAGFTPIMPR